jgi:hypothetical protein
MKINYRKAGISVFLFIVLSCAVRSNLVAQNVSDSNQDSIAGGFNIKNASFLLPQHLPKGQYSSALYLLNVVIPAAWTLDNIRAPMFCYAAKYTLPSGFNLQASLSTLIISNRINLGPFWNYSKGNYHVGVGYQVAFNYGVLNQFGFHTTLTGWEQQPSVALGYSFTKTAITIRGDLYYTSSLQVSEGGNVVPYNNDFLNGSSITISLEQRLWKDRVMSFGFKLSDLRYHILAWPAFPVNKNSYLVPEFQLGLNF